MSRGQIILSQRLEMLKNMITPGLSLVDVGCDHGFLSISCVQNGISPRVLAMDVRKGPLAAAQEHIATYGLNEQIETRLSDGLQAMTIGEAEAMVCAGMGGPLMQKILTDSPDKAKSLKELILQPQSEIKEFRAFLREEHFEILDEQALYEEGKYYFAMKVVYRGEAYTDSRAREVFDAYGRQLLLRQDPVLKDFLMFRRDILEQIEENLRSEDSEKAVNRLEELQREKDEIREALTFYGA